MEKKCQAHNLKVVGSNPTPQPTYSIKSIAYTYSKSSVFGFFLCLKVIYSKLQKYLVIRIIHIKLKKNYEIFLKIYPIVISYSVS